QHRTEHGAGHLHLQHARANGVEASHKRLGSLELVHDSSFRRFQKKIDDVQAAVRLATKPSTSSIPSRMKTAMYQYSSGRRSAVRVVGAAFAKICCSVPSFSFN